MATKKDLVEAHSFSRRRLVTAFVSGAPGGREVEPARPGRTIVGGIALAILLVAGAAVAGVFNSRVEVDWEQAGIVQDKDTGDLFVILPDAGDTGIAGDEPRVRGIVNVTSARLILGSEEELQSVPHDEVASEPKGATIGIPGAPSAPAADSLVQSGWSACTSDGRGVQVALSSTPLVTAAPTKPFTVKAGDDFYVIAEADGVGSEPRRAHAYPIPDDASDEVTSNIGAADRDSAITVPPAFVDLFAPGSTLDETGLGLQDIGQDAPDGPGVPANARIGDTFALGDEIGIFTQDGPSEAISPFAQAVLEAATESRKGDFDSVRRDVDSGALDLQPVTYDESGWPTDLLDPDEQSSPTDSACAVLDPSSDEVPVMLLATDPFDEATPEGVGRTGSDVYVDTGSGAVVVSAGMDSTSGSAAVLLDDRGYAYDLVGSAVTNLGYGELSLPVVPQSWTQLFEEGTPLSRDAALCPPALGEAPECG